MAVERAGTQVRWHTVRKTQGVTAMTLDWKSVKTEHVRKACETLLVSDRPRDRRQHGLFVTFHGVDLPAKAVLAMAYRLAKTRQADAIVRFSSGDATISRLRSLGFDATRRRVGSQDQRLDERKV